jgi:cytochrome c oxidase subunit 2
VTTQSTPEQGWVDPYERIWIIVAILMLVGLVGAITVASIAFGIQVPVPEKRVDPNTVTQAGPFSEPGLRDLGGGKYEAYIVGRSWAWSPKELIIPVGSTVTFFITSQDVQHGFMLWNTNLNVQIVPGQVSKLTITFDEPGEYPYLCHEYCGVGHHTMAGKVIVE